MCVGLRSDQECCWQCLCGYLLYWPACVSQLFRQTHKRTDTLLACRLASSAAAQSTSAHLFFLPSAVAVAVAVVVYMQLAS